MYTPCSLLGTTPSRLGLNSTFLQERPRLNLSKWSHSFWSADHPGVEDPKRGMTVFNATA